ncbi:hypothetical protein MBLNU459_g2167t1 [Dothideomycetes sp. NU459]
MDSMRSLNRSLPRTSPHRQTAPQPPEALLSAFKAAALSVTNLYKTAASDQARARAAGYQDALDDLLTLMDKENLGVQDGEGWRIRQWATERFDGSAAGKADNSEDEEDDEDKGRSSSPEVARKAAVPETQHEHQEPPAPVEPPVQQVPLLPRADMTVPTSDTFNFRSMHSYPSNHDRQDADMDSTTVPGEAATITLTRPTRNSRHHNRSSNTSSNNNNSSNNGGGNRNSTINLGSLGSGAGSKRKNTFNEFFNIPEFPFGNRKDEFDRGGKRGRHA